MADSTVPAKPSKPYPEFPLYAHASKRWAKKIKGRTHFFGKWDNWQGALERFQYEVDYLQQGRTPPPRDEMALSVGDMVNHLLEDRDAKVNSGELSPITLRDLKRQGTKIIDFFGRHTSVESLRPSDFAKFRDDISARGGLVNLATEITRTNTFFNFAEKNLDVKVRMGSAFDKPSRKSIRREAETKPQKCFNLAELRILYHAAGPHLKAFMLLALNGGMGNRDIALLEHRHIVGKAIDYKRTKTLVSRGFPLWKETVAAIESVRSDHEQYVFLTKYKALWAKDGGDSAITKEFRKLCDETGLHAADRGFYALRHTFRTVADGCRDQVAVNYVMGHADDSMGAAYREWIEPDRLQAVVDHVYQWVKPMFKKPASEKAGAI
jgi:integrase